MSVWNQRVRAIHIAVRRNPDTVADVLAASDKVLREAGERICHECGETRNYTEAMSSHYHATVGYHDFVPGNFLVIPLDALAPEGSE